MSNNVRLIPISADKKTTGIDFKISNLNPNIEWLGLIDADSGYMLTAWNKTAQIVTVSGFSTLNDGTTANRVLFYAKVKLNNGATLTPTAFGTVEAYHNGQTASVLICPTQTVEQTPPSVFRLFPTPATDEIWIEHSDKNIHYFLIFNVLGQIIEKIPVSNNLTQFNISHFATGTYWLRSDKIEKALPFVKL